MLCPIPNVLVLAISGHQLHVAMTVAGAVHRIRSGHQPDAFEDALE